MTSSDHRGLKLPLTTAAIGNSNQSVIRNQSSPYRGTQRGRKLKLSGKRLGAPPAADPASRQPFDPSQTSRTELARCDRRSKPAHHPPCSRRCCVDDLQRWPFMPSAPRAPRTRSTCSFTRRHGRSTHLHVSVELHASHSHDHMTARMYMLAWPSLSWIC